MQEEKENCKCPHCGASMAKRPHRVSKGLVESLVKFKVKVCELDRNSLHLQTDLDFTKSQFTNFQKLRYHGLIAKCFDKENYNKNNIRFALFAQKKEKVSQNLYREKYLYGDAT